MRQLKIFLKFVFNYRVAFISFLFFAMICSSVQAQTGMDELSSAFSSLEDHIEGVATLDTARINDQTEIIENNIKLIGQNDSIISQAFDLVELYEDKKDPLFINSRTRSGIPHDNYAGVELDWAMFQIQQGLMDYAYTLENIQRYDSIFDGAKYETSKYFPGYVEPPSDPDSIYQVEIKCTMREVWGSPVMYSQDVARRPTGAYLAPGSIAEVIVPETIVGKGFRVRVGAHSWDLSNKRRYKRLHRVSLTYPIDSTVVRVANPLGGGIYIEVPYKADGGVQTIEFKNTVRSPFFSARSFDKTTLEEWQNEERHHPGPWTDFESDKFMMQIPTKWIYNYDDPVSLMEDWDTAMDGVSELFGLPLVRNITVLYLQTDVLIRGSAYFPGYPQSNITYNPTAAVDGNKNHYLLKGPQYASHVLFHELGHAQRFTKFSGESEAVVNLPYVAVQNDKFGMPLDEAFGRSFGNPNMSLDQAAIAWMVARNFRQGDPMEARQMAYQHRGYGKYVEIARLFGWDALSRFWHSVQEDYLEGITYSRNSDPTDSRIIRMSKAAGADLTPLIHFWGIHPEDPEALKDTMEAEGIQPSDTIYDMLKHYQSIVPMNNEDFLDHANTIYPNGLREANPNYGIGWYYVWASKYDERHGVAAANALHNIINHYFPKKEAPKVPANFQAIPGDEVVYLSWDENTGEKDFKKHYVYRSTTPGSGYSLIDSTSRENPEYMDYDVTNNTTYYYVVTSEDVYDNESDFSDEDSATPAVNVAPEAPVNFDASADDKNVYLSWDENTEKDLTGYYLYRSATSGSGYSLIDSTLKGKTKYKDEDVACNTTYYYVITAADMWGKASGYSEEASAKPVDNVAPYTPTNLKASTDGDQVVVDLSWDKNLTSDLGGYHVYRSTTAGSGYRRIDTTLAIYPNYLDEKVANNTTYYYVVTAADKWDNESGFSNEVSAKPTDVKPPKAPTGLKATAEDGSVNLTWDENREGDLAGYLLYRATPSSESYSELNTSLIEIPSYTDNNVVSGATYYYKITAVDTVDNESDPSSPTIVTLPDADTVTAVFGANEEFPGIKVFPNPGDGTNLFVEWEGMSDQVSIAIRNVSGVTVYQELVSGSKTRIPAAKVSEQGFYIISVVGDHYKVNTKLLVR